MMGPGKYDAACSAAREQTKARGALLIVLGGELGNGFSCQADLLTMEQIPDILEKVARQIREDMRGGGGPRPN